MSRETKDSDGTTPRTFSNEFFSPKSWAFEGLGLLAFGALASLFLTGSLNFKEDWEWYAVALGFLAPSLAVLLTKGKLTKRVVAVIALLAFVLAEAVFLLFVANG